MSSVMITNEKRDYVTALIRSGVELKVALDASAIFGDDRAVLLKDESFARDAAEAAAMFQVEMVKRITSGRADAGLRWYLQSRYPGVFGQVAQGKLKAAEASAASRGAVTQAVESSAVARMEARRSERRAKLGLVK